MSAPVTRRALFAFAIALLARAAAGAGTEPPARPSRAALGVVTRDPLDFEREMWRLEGGAWVVKVNDGAPAARAGIGRDDVIAAIDDAPVADSAALVALLAARQPGERVKVRLVRRGHPVEVEAVLGAAR